MRTGAFELLKSREYIGLNTQFHLKWVIKRLEPLIFSSKHSSPTLWKAAWLIFFYINWLRESKRISIEEEDNLGKLLLKYTVEQPDLRELPVSKFLNKTYLFGKSKEKALIVNDFFVYFLSSLGLGKNYSSNVYECPKWIKNAQLTIQEKLQIEKGECSELEQSRDLSRYLSNSELEMIAFIILVNLSLSESRSVREYDVMQQVLKSCGVTETVIHVVESELAKLGMAN